MPYIPIEHEKYDILPYCRGNGGEVFSYDVEMENEIGAMLPDGASVIPYGYESYEEFDDCLDEYILMLGISDGQLNILGRKILKYKADIKKRNVKENWSVVKYVGETTGLFGLTHGRHYYWPCSADKPEYEGIIDDEEFTSYLMCDMNSDVVYQSLDEAAEKASFHEYHKPCSNWEIVEDPTGMALRILEGTGSITKKTIKIRMSPVHAERKKADRYPGVGWNCDNCGDYLCAQPGFDDHNDLWACLKCGYENHISRLEIFVSEEAFQKHRDWELGYSGETQTDNAQSRLITDFKQFYGKTVQIVSNIGKMFEGEVTVVETNVFHKDKDAEENTMVIYDELRGACFRFRKEDIVSIREILR
ncbi:MAG: hypothetical protein FWH57_09305 [Oscillospiraceae bacterium]|nr:hypothetical protein [Oscillospiraceae bacterium]